ncbi:hypothetical protein PIB30_107245, partial [Stylosanthes scabra]|nr:hypothetical protein [Stylosanthes scabra]
PIRTHFINLFSKAAFHAKSATAAPFPFRTVTTAFCRIPSLRKPPSQPVPKYSFFALVCQIAAANPHIVVVTRRCRCPSRRRRLLLSFRFHCSSSPPLSFLTTASSGRAALIVKFFAMAPSL